MRKPLQRRLERRTAAGEDYNFRLLMLRRRILDVEIDNGAVCQYQVVQQCLIPKAQQETTAGTYGQIVFPVRVCPAVDLSRFDRNPEVNIAVGVTMAGSKAPPNPDRLNAAIRIALLGHCADQIGMGTVL